MKKLYSFVILTMLIASFSMTATAQHYVRVNNDTKSTNGRILYANSILPTEIADTTSVMYIHIINVKNGRDTGGVENGRKFLITKFSPTLGGIHFNDDTNNDRYDCFSKGEVLVSIDEDFVPYKDIKFVSSTSVVLDNTEVFNTIKSQCVYDENSRKLDLTKCQFDYIYNGIRHRGDSQYNVSSDSKIEFLTGSQNIPNIVLEANTFVQPQADADKLGDKVVNNGDYKYLKEILACIFGFVLIIFILWLIFGKRANKNKNLSASPESSTMDGRAASQANASDPKANNVATLVSKETKIVSNSSNDELLEKMNELSEIVSAVNKQNETLKEIYSLVSSTDDKKSLKKLQQELKAKESELSNAKRDLEKSSSEIKKLKSEIEQLEKSNQIDGVVQVAEYSTFVLFAKKTIAECVKVEKIVINYWNSLSIKDQQIINSFFSKYLMLKSHTDLAKWNGIIATLDLKGYIKNDEYITYLTPLSDKDRMVFLNKRFFEDILRPYVGATVLFLEQIRTASKLGVSTACKENIDGFINSICTKCSEQGVKIDYRKLYETVTEYDSLEIDENIPATIKKVIDKIEDKDILLYVDKYAVNLASGEMQEKTHCYIKI